MTNLDLNEIKTPCYVYDLNRLRDTLDAIKSCIKKHGNYHVHYAVKACATAEVLHEISQAGFGADCVSGGEIQCSIKHGFHAKDIVYAGVGKADWEIKLALESGISMFNVESLAELEVINEIAILAGKVARVTFRVNPNVDAHTHAKITTGLIENKFGIDMLDLIFAIRRAQTLSNIEFVGLHFHIGSQITDMTPFKALCHRINDILVQVKKEGIKIDIINVGGGLGVDYEHPEEHPIPDFESYFRVFADELRVTNEQELHFELGRSIVAQCGTLFSKVLYVKQGHHKQFVIVDAGMTDLIRPALYDAYHKAVNLTSKSSENEIYDIVGPICESSDVFHKDYVLPITRRGDIIAFHTAGAYGEIMASQYNCRNLPNHILR